MTTDEKLEEPPATEESSVTDESSVTETSATTEESQATEETDDRSHLSDLPDGSGCTEIWEHLSEQREREADEE